MSSKFNTDGLMDYYKNQVFKLLGLFEIKDKNGHKYAVKLKSEFECLPSQFDTLYDHYQFNIIVGKLDVLIDELLLLDGEHQLIKNEVFETMNLLEDMKEYL
ncbi:hypothetical protein [Oceanobacillus oncorhynchi]|uniref:hypothetical protein n=1 Tax=Oceanobacillus oncorhynchi TaxID=545501 RepID=UPI0034D4481B